MNTDKAKSWPRMHANQTNQRKFVFIRENSRPNPTEISSEPRLARRAACLMFRRDSVRAWFLSDLERQRLKILLRPATNPVQRLVQVLHGVGDAEAQIAFTEFAKRCAGKAGDTR